MDTGEVLWDVTWETRLNGSQEHRQLEIQEHGYGQPWGYEAPVRWQKRMTFQVAPVVRMDSLTGQRFGQDGRRLSRIEIQADPQRRVVRYRDTGRQDHSSGTEIPWVEDLFADEFLFHWVRTLSFEAEPAGELTLLVSSKRWFRMQARVRGQEIVETPAGTYLCHRVDLTYNGLLLKAFAPKLSLWCTVKPPHFWVRYEGPIGGPGSPRAVLELVRYRSGEA